MSLTASAQEINHGLEYLTQLGALYGVTHLADDLFPGVSLKIPAQAVVEDLGRMFIMAEQSINAMRDYDALLLKGEGPIAISAETLKRVHLKLSRWTSFSRWLRLLLAAERRWQKNLRYLASAVPKNRSMIDLLKASSEEREALLLEVKDSLSATYLERNSSYAIPVPL